MLRSRIPFDMFDVERRADEARRYEKLSSLYHRGQELAWDGRAVLAELIARHGGIRLADDKRPALSRIFGIILWGELAAWKISAQLADRLEPLEARMAATSQAHDEARHFYVMAEYLRTFGDVPRSIDWRARRPLEMVLATDDVVEKLIGMQLQVESLALVIFQAVRESGVEPVLCDLLRYYEKDEARHIGLGVQHLPSLLRRQRPWQAVRLIAFQLRIIAWVTAELKALAPDLRALGIDPRRILELGTAKQSLVYDQLWSQMGGPPRTRRPIANAIDAVNELLFPPPEARTLRARMAGAARMAVRGRERIPTTLE